MERHGLTAYDAQYLALAEQLDVSLVTIDRRLAVAAGERAIDPTSSGSRLSESPTPYGSTGRVTWPDYHDVGTYLATLRAELERARREPTVSP